MFVYDERLVTYLALIFQFFSLSFLSPLFVFPMLDQPKINLGVYPPHSSSTTLLSAVAPYLSIVLLA